MDNKKSKSPNRRKQKICLTATFFCAFTMAIVTSNNNDLIIISSAIPLENPYQNFLGIVGAWVAFFSLNLFGLATYPLTLTAAGILILKFSKEKLLEIDKELIQSAILLTISTILILGTFPEFWQQATLKLGILNPGGIVGKYLASPTHGWLTWLFNQTGTIFLAGCGIVSAIVISWSRFRRKKENAKPSIKSTAKGKDQNTKKPNGKTTSATSFFAGFSQGLNRILQPKAPKQLKTNTPLEKPKDSDDICAANTIPAVKEASDEPLGVLVNETHQPVPTQDKANGKSNILSESKNKREDQQAIKEAEVKLNNKEERPSKRPNSAQEDQQLLLARSAAQAAANKSKNITAAEDMKIIIDQSQKQRPSITPNKSNDPNAYICPVPSLINKLTEGGGVSIEEQEDKKAVIQETLDSFRIPAKTGDAMAGPRVTLFEVIPEKTVRVEKVAKLNNNFAMELEAENVRILAPIPGRRSIGIEVPNSKPSTVCFRQLAEKALENSKGHLPIALGKNIEGQAAVMDLAKAPHLLVAGATGAGKSVFMNTLILSLLLRYSPSDLQLILVDPKVVEFAPYAKLPHLICPVITEPSKVPAALNWACKEMDSRYSQLAEAGVRNIIDFNKRDYSKDPVPNIDKKLPYTVIIIDELADLMMVAKADIETSIARIAQKARAVGIHLVLATQRPSVNVITGLIKANFPTRISFQVTSNVDSKTILDRKGAEMLLGQGDMLYLPPGTSNLERIQGAFVPDGDIAAIVDYCAGQKEQNFIDLLLRPANDENEEGSEESELMQQAVEVLKSDKKSSISHLQRRLRIGYNRSASLIEDLEKAGYLGEPNSRGVREILCI